MKKEFMRHQVIICVRITRSVYGVYHSDGKRALQGKSFSGLLLHPRNDALA
jgi:hypothetical protein